MQFYLDLLAGDKTVQDLTDAELEAVKGSWMDEKNVMQPPFKVWVAIRDELRAREVERASKIMKRIDKDFFNVKS